MNVGICCVLAVPNYPEHTFGQLIAHIWWRGSRRCGDGMIRVCTGPPDRSASIPAKLAQLRRSGESVPDKIGFAAPIRHWSVKRPNHGSQSPCPEVRS